MTQGRTEPNEGQAFVGLAQTVRELRVRCPWDRDQTIESLSKHLIEEAYEIQDAIDSGNTRGLVDELGDLLSQLLFMSVIAEEQQHLSLKQVLEEARAKLIRRHPHVYGQVEAATPQEVVEHWEVTKRAERERAGATSALAGVAHALPALMRAEKIGQRARSAGMDWSDVREVLAKVDEELAEAREALAAGRREAAAEEIGDALLALANAPRFLERDAEATLRDATERFIRRFGNVERLARERGLDLTSMAPEEVERLWQEAKAALRHR